MNVPSVSVIIAVYNKIDWLLLLLSGFEKQSFRDFEIVVADDGSNKEFVHALNEYIQTSPLRIQHVWHKDKGFRKTRILNKAVLQSKGEYIIFIDGDCLPDRNFVADHWYNRAPDTILAGRRANLSQKLTQTLSAEKIRNGLLESTAFLRKVWVDSFRKITNHAEKSVRLPRSIYRMLPAKSKGILGCNFSLHKSDLLQINGFDTRYEAPATGEDTDIDLRLRWAGKKIRLLRFQAIQFHIYHTRLDRPNDNDRIFAEVMAQKKAVTSFGIREMQNDLA
ncbi:glycosyltransferase [Pontibacter toksunensis]|uniref:Glycosyltransferase n=1 Tax=Pontibacter toksunensis TaxID=1332631 RepID=A0ABW6BT87_9BACT